MKKTTISKLMAFLFFAVLCVLAGSCNQDPIFFAISNEPVRKDPRIPGNPTHFAVVNNVVYVGGRMSRTIFSYTSSGWSSMSTPGGSLGELASDDTNLYALVYPNGNPLSSSVICRFDGSDWSTIARDASANPYSIQTIYSAGGEIFAGGQIRHSSYAEYAILYLDKSAAPPVVKVLISNTSLITGAAESGGEFYLATAGSGIYKYDGFGVVTGPIEGTFGANMQGIIETGGDIAAVSSDGVNRGRIFIYRTTSSELNQQELGLNFTGAMGVWKQFNSGTGTWESALLLLGIRSHSYYGGNGYREMHLTDEKPTFATKPPGETYGTPTSAREYNKFNASLGRHPVHAILQVPEEVIPYTNDPGWNPPIFAATSKDGVWSYRNEQWNAED